MADLHDHWQTDDAEDAKDAEDANKGKIRIESESEPTKTISRKPAAIVGILMVTALASTFFYGTDRLRGQLVNAEEIAVNITQGGPEPRTLLVRHGDSVRFINRSTAVHVMSSKTLCSDHLTPSTCMRTDSIFPGENTSYTIPETALITTHVVVSDGSDFDTPFQIIVRGEAGSPVASPAPVDTGTAFGGQTHNPVDVGNILEQLDEPVVPTSTTTSSTSQPAGFVIEKQQLTQELTSGLQAANIPTNPYTVAGVRRAPVGADLHPAPSMPPHQYAMPPPSPHPFAQPETGAETIALTLLLALGGITAVSWRVLHVN